jgi:hypothetical protein
MSASARTRLCVRADIGLSARTRSSPCPCPPSVPPRSPCADGLLRLRGRAKTKIKKIKFILFYFLVVGCWKREEKNVRFSVFQSARSVRSPSSPRFAGDAARRRRFFWPSSHSHPSKLYSSLGWLNSKVPKPFFPFTPRLIDVDGF